MWAELMAKIDNVPLQLRTPAGVEYHWIDAHGRLAAEHCDDAVAYPFIAGSEPSERSDCSEQRGLEGFLRGLFD